MTLKIILCWILFVSVPSLVFPEDQSGVFEYEYSVKRNKMQEEEKRFSGYKYDFTEDEQMVNNYLEFLKLKEFNRTRDDFPPARPIKLHIASVKSSEVYQTLKRFPKGGNLHLHHNHVVSKSKILDIIFASPLYDNLHVKVTEPNAWRLDFFVTPPKGWTKVKDNRKYSKSFLIKHATLLGMMDEKAINEPTNSALRWHQMDPLFSVIGSKIINQAHLTSLHMEAMLQAAINENVQYLETRSSAYNKLYILDSDKSYSSNHGKRFIDDNDGQYELQLVASVVKQFKKANSNFIGYKRIINSYRRRNKEYIEQEIKKALRLYEKYPNLIAGFDLVAEEDKGFSLLYFMEVFAKIAAQNKSLPYYFHAGETNWKSDITTSINADDPVATMENIYDAIILGAKRVGHGIGYLSRPYLMEIMKEKQIAIVANPVSNKMLGYVPDQRHHPAITYLRYGIPVVLGSDDPATFGYNEFTLDWYEVFMGWGLNLADLRQLAVNSLKHSSLSTSEKSPALVKWKIAWNTFISQTKSKACAESFSNVTPYISSIFPKEGKINGGTRIQVFGRNFRVAICKTIFCRFGTETTNGTLLYDHILTCISPQHNPPVVPNSSRVSFGVSFDGGLSFHESKITFTYF